MRNLCNRISAGELVKPCLRTVILAGFFLASGCSAIDRINPFARRVDAPVTGNAAIARERARQAVEAASDEPYPELSDVPERPVIASRAGIQRALVADRAGATSSGQILRQSGTAVPAGVPTGTAAQDASIRAGSAGGTYRGPAPDAAGIEQLRQQLASVDQVRVAVIQFEFNSTSLSDPDFAILGQVAQIAELTDASVFVIGHASGVNLGAANAADTIAAERASLEVSMARANAVADGIIGAGVAADRVTVRGVGTNEPAYLEETIEAEAGNRRAEIYLRN